MKLLLLIILYTFCTLSSQATHPLQEQIQQITANTDVHVGVALIIDGKDTITINNDDRYPLMSVMKYHQALAVAHYLDKHHLPPFYLCLHPQRRLTTRYLQPVARPLSGREHQFANQRIAHLYPPVER